MKSSGKRVASEKSVQNKETPSIRGATEEGAPKKGEKKVPTREENRRRGRKRGQTKKKFPERRISKYVHKTRAEN